MFGDNTEGLLEELMADEHVHDYFLVSWARLIVGDPSPIHELEPPLRHQTAYNSLGDGVLQVPPLLEVKDFRLRKFPTFILKKRSYD